MRPPLGPPPVERSTAEHVIIKRRRRAQLFVFLRHHRQTLFAAPLQQELLTLAKDQPQGQPPVPPAQRALAALLQASTQVSDDEGREATTMDRRWPVGLDGLDCDTPPFSQGTLVVFRQRLSAQPLDRRLLEGTVEIAAASGACGPRQLRAALDSRPLWGAGRVEDPSHWRGHALRKAVGVMARQPGRGLRAIAGEAGASLGAGSRVQAALALDWDDPGARQPALPMILASLTAVEQWLDTPPGQAETTSHAVARLAVAQQVCAQDRTTTPAGTPTRRQGVADRRMRVAEAERRHGRKRRRRRSDGYKRHVLRDLDRGLIVAGGVTPANVPEASGTDAIATDVATPPSTLQERHIDRAYLASTLVQQRPDTMPIFCKAWPGHPGPYWANSACHLDGERHARPCPGGERMPCMPGEGGQLPAAACARCAWRERCPTSASGRRVTLHPAEAWLPELCERQPTPQGRAKLRERVAVAHALAHVGRWQGRCARD